MTKRDVLIKFMAGVPSVDAHALIARVDLMQPGALDKESKDPERELKQLRDWYAVAQSMPIQQVSDEVEAMEGVWARRN